jgi:hypothetical protein
LNTEKERKWKKTYPFIYRKERIVSPLHSCDNSALSVYRFAAYSPLWRHRGVKNKGQERRKGKETDVGR